MELLIFKVLQACFLILLVQLKLVFGQQCPTWFQAQPGAINNSYCECGSSLGGAIECDNVTKEVSIALQYCMTYSNVSGKEQLVVGLTNSVFLKGSSQVYSRLPGNVSELNDFMCSDSNRKGLLCGECISGYGYAINSYNNQCAKCDTAYYGVGMFLLCAILPMTICFLLIIMLRLSVPSGFLFAYVMFCQTIVVIIKYYTLLYYDILNSLDSFGKFNLKLSITLAGLSNYFIGVYYLIEPTCIHHSISEIQAVFIQYIYCLYPLLLLFLTWLCIELHARNCKIIVLVLKPFNHCLAKLQWNWSVSDCVIHAYATLYFLSFLHLVSLSFSIIHSLKIYDIKFAAIRTVLMYDPTMEWFSSHHLFYAIPAMLMLLLLGVLPTLLLCQQSTKVFRKCLTFRSRTQLMIDTFVESFASGYKDGFNNTYNFRFLSSMPMIIAFSMFLCFPSHGNQSIGPAHIIFSLLFLITALLFAFFKPYKSTYLNISLCFHSTLLALCNMLVILWYIGSGDVISSKVLVSCFILFTLLPHVVAVTTISYHCLHHIPFVQNRMELLSGKLSSFFKRSAHHEMSATSSILPDRLENSSEYRRL